MLTPQDVADALNANGIDTPAKLGDFVKFAGSILQRNTLAYQIQHIQEDRRAANQAADRQVAALNAQVADLDKTLAGR